MAEIDKRDKLIRDGRKATKQALTDSDPVMQRLIAKVNKRNRGKGTAPAKTVGK